MLYELMMSLKGSVPGANLFSYITFRAGGAVMTALIISFILGPWVIDNLRMRQGKGQPIREDGPQSHLVTKVGTPTMGGLLILLAVTLLAVCAHHVLIHRLFQVGLWLYLCARRRVGTFVASFLSWLFRVTNSGFEEHLCGTLPGEFPPRRRFGN